MYQRAPADLERSLRRLDTAIRGCAVADESILMRSLDFYRSQIERQEREIGRLKREMNRGAKESLSKDEARILKANLQRERDRAETSYAESVFLRAELQHARTELSKSQQRADVAETLEVARLRKMLAKHKDTIQRQRNELDRERKWRSRVLEWMQNELSLTVSGFMSHAVEGP